MAVMTVVVVVALAWGPVLVVVGVVQVHWGDQIRQHGVRTTATVLHEDPAGDPVACASFDVSYWNQSGRAERALVNADGCRSSGSTLEVIYDPAMPHTARLVDLGRTDARVDIMSGIALTALIWSLAGYGVVDALRRRRAGTPSA